MLETTRATQSLLDLEDAEPDILFESLDGARIPLWPQVRMAFASSLAETELGSTPVVGVSDPWAVRRRLAKALLPSRWDARGIRRHADVCALVGGVTTSLTPGGVRNWLVADYLDDLGDDAVILQWNPLPGALGRPEFARTRSLDPVDARSDFRAHRRPLGAATLARIDLLVSGFAAALDADIPRERVEAIIATTRRQEVLRRLIEEELSRILDAIDPRVVLQEDASYGHRGSLTALMKERGIRVAEPQHGWIGPSHGAYNFGRAMHRADMRVALPDELLTFGDFWSESIRTPYKTTVIGKPHLEARAASALPHEERPPVLLVVSSVAEPDATARLVRAVGSALPSGWIVRFRPHPSERAAFAQRYGSLVDAPGIEVDERPDAYESLAEARVVVGAASTVLFEAAAFDCDVVVRDSAFVPYYVGDLFGTPVSDDDVEHIVSVATAGTGPRYEREARAAQFFAPSARARAREWMRAALVR